MDIFNGIMGAICVLGSIFWFMWFLAPTAKGSTGEAGPGKLMNRMAYLLSSCFVLQTALDAFGVIEITKLM